MTRIQRISAYEVVVPVKPGIVCSKGWDHPGLWDWDKLPICLLSCEMDDGIVGLGEVLRGVSLADVEPWLMRLVGQELAGPGLGALPSHFRYDVRYNDFTGAVNSGLLDNYPPTLWNPYLPVMNALEMVLLDWAGKRLECRAVDLLGGAYREAVPVDLWAGRLKPEDLAPLVTRGRELGFGGIKMKSMNGDPVIDQVRAIREAGGDKFSITIDPMSQWLSPHDCLGTIRELEQFGSGIRLEDPFPQDRADFWHRTRQSTYIPLVWHARNLASLRRALQEQCMDAMNVSDGIWEFMTHSGAIEVMGYSCWRGSSLELGVGQAAGLHAAAASRSCTMPSDFQSAMLREKMLVDYDFPYHEGTLPLPAGHGIGVELDMDTVNHYKQTEAVYQVGD